MPAFIFDLTGRRHSAGSPEILLPGKFSDVRSTDPADKNVADSVVAYCDEADAFVSAYRLPLPETRLSMMLKLAEYEEKVLATLCTRQRRIARVALKSSRELDISPKQDGKRRLLLLHPFAISSDAVMPLPIGRHSR